MEMYWLIWLLNIYFKYFIICIKFFLLVSIFGFDNLILLLVREIKKR